MPLFFPRAVPEPNICAPAGSTTRADVVGHCFCDALSFLHRFILCSKTAKPAKRPAAISKIFRQKRAPPYTSTVIPYSLDEDLSPSNVSERPDAAPLTTTPAASS